MRIATIPSSLSPRTLTVCRVLLPAGSGPTSDSNEPLLTGAANGIAAKSAVSGIKSEAQLDSGADSTDGCAQPAMASLLCEEKTRGRAAEITRDVRIPGLCHAEVPRQDLKGMSCVNSAQQHWLLNLRHVCQHSSS